MNPIGEQVKQALECLANCKECKESESCEYYMQDNDVCMCDNISIARDTLDYINSLETENRTFQVENEKLREVKEQLENDIINERMNYENSQEQIANLNIELQAMRNAANGYKKECNKLSSLIPKARAEAVKEMAEILEQEEFVPMLTVERIKNAICKTFRQKPVAKDKYGFLCPCCRADLGVDREDISVYDMTPPHNCEHCGQALDWEGL